VAFVREDDDSCVVAVTTLDGTAPTPLSSADYAWDPAWAPDGSRVAWHEWDLPNMPWDGGRICAAAPDGSDRREVAGGDREGVGQPRWSPDGRHLAFVTDRSGWANVWVGDPAGLDARPAAPAPAEQAEPPWGPGQRSYAWSPDGRALAVCRNEDGFGQLVTLRDRTVTTRVDGWHHGLDWGERGIVAVRSSAGAPSTVTVLADDGQRRPVARGPAGGFEAAGLVEPDPVTWAADDGTPVHGLLFRPARRADGRPPLLVDVHGGPTGQATATWEAWPQFLVSRGWAVLAPNGRGSTGYGRDYAQALAGGWGCADVADVAAGIRHAGTAGWCDARRVVASGRSAGAFTALLLAVRHPELLRAAISQYGVTDLLRLAETTHRFESRYLDRLVGPLPDDADRYRERSPLTHAAAIRVPILVLHGDADRVVPPAQAAALVGAVRAGGGVAESRVYEAEGHGWSRADTIADVHERVAAFLRRHVPDC
jgi:dipeptidyl aminopeptidase/acylaminoacyl peptidase